MNWQSLGSHPLMDPPLFKRISPYVFNFDDLLGKGSFSKVYKGRNEQTSQQVAVKVIELASLKSSTLQRLLQSELQVMKILDHPNILKCHDILLSDRNCYIITELCNEGSLDVKIRLQGCFDEKKAVPIIRDVFQGLCYLAKNHIVHRDLKVANIFLHNSRAKIADFGFATFFRNNFKDVSIGSPLYMSPEGFINNIYGCKTDIWAFGVFVYEILLGHPPLLHCKNEEDLFYAMTQQITKDNIDNKIPDYLKQLIIQCMQIDQTKRPSTQDLELFPILQKNQNKQKWTMPYQSIHIHQIKGNTTSNTTRQRLLNERRCDKGSVQSSSSKTTAELIYTPHPPFKLSLQKKALGSNISSKIYPPAKRCSLSPEKVQPSSTFHQDNTYFDFKFFKGALNFEVLVNALHYGRLLFKFISLQRNQQYNPDELVISTFAKWLIAFLEEIEQKVKRKEVIYTHNSALWQAKLLQVCVQYQKKYRFELNSYLNQKPSKKSEEKYSLQFFKYYCYGLFLQFDPMVTSGSSKEFLMMAHCLILICDGAKILRQCFATEKYKQFRYFTDAELLLNEKKYNVNWQSYNLLRQRLLNF